jgi:serine/threonine protein kinase
MPAEASSSSPQVVGNYELLAKVAEGGMGTVYKGRHRETGQIVAIKIVAKHIAGNQVLLKRFEQEYIAAKQLNHPNIVRALEYGENEGTPFLVMEFVDGESLGRRLQREGAMPAKEAVRLIGQVAQALHVAHKDKLIHRDVKPDNILINQEGQAKLTDLGLVKEMEADLNLTRTGRGLGTPHFMAPEQFKNAKNVDPRCDIYSLAATLYMMVTGEMPFRSANGPLDAYLNKVDGKLKSPREIVPELSERLDWAIRRAMNPNPDERPATCREFYEDLIGKSSRKPTSGVEPGAAQADVWYLVYKDENGIPHTVKGGTAGICKSLREGLLGDASNVRASRTKSGAFEPLRSFPEFRHLVLGTPSKAAPAPRAARGGRSAAVSPDQPTTPAPAYSSRPGRPRPPTSDADEAEESVDRGRTWPAWLIWVLLGVVTMAASALVGYFFIFR